jgi:hypothetical protein
VSFTVTPPLNTIAAVEATIDASTHGDAVTDPIPLTLLAAFNLGDMTPGNAWEDLLDVLADKGKFVALDLSACAMSGTEFAPYTASATGEDKVVSLTLPTAALTMTDGTIGDSPFKHFTALTTVSGANITAVSEYAFTQCTALASVDFPKATTIGNNAFSGCHALASVASTDFPKVETLGESAFNDCTALASVDFPEVKTIGNTAFMNCSRLASVSIPAVETVTGPQSFNNVGTDTSVTSFSITIKADCTFNGDNNLVWGGSRDAPGVAFKTVYDATSVGSTSKAAQAGGTYTCDTSTGTWTYSAP